MSRYNTTAWYNIDTFTWEYGCYPPAPDDGEYPIT